jgi:hypothetical protein
MMIDKLEKERDAFIAKELDFKASYGSERYELTLAKLNYAIAILEEIVTDEKRPPCPKLKVKKAVPKPVIMEDCGCEL